MNKVLIDRDLLERAVYSLELAYEADTPTVRGIAAVLVAPSGTPELPVKAYYYESTTPEGVRTRSVGLEVRKTFADAPLVLESDALAGFAMRDARIVELEAAPVAKPQVVMPERMSLGAATRLGQRFEVRESFCTGANYMRDEFARLNAAPVQQVSVPDGWKLVPVEPTPEMMAAAIRCYGNDDDCYRAMLAAAPAAPQPFATDDKGEPLGWIEQDKTNTALHTEAAPAADAWISVSERLPLTDGQYWCFFSEEHPSTIKQRVCIFMERHQLFCDWTVTHWMPLPAAPSANSAQRVV